MAFRRFWVKEPRHSEKQNAAMCYLSPRTRLYGYHRGLLSLHLRPDECASLIPVVLYHPPVEGATAAAAAVESETTFGSNESATNQT